MPTSSQGSPTTDSSIEPRDTLPLVVRNSNARIASSKSISSPRWSLIIKARTLRFLAGIGFYLHNLARPAPPSPSFIRYYTTTTLNGTGDTRDNGASLKLNFYVPADYNRQIQRGHKYPLVVNFHGGGFTIGSPTDDARWAASIVREVTAVVVSAQYRLAPEYPFPTAVEDGVSVLLHLGANAESLGIDACKTTLSGFSAGGNLAFTVPLRLQTYIADLQHERGGNTLPTIPNIVSIIAWYPSIDNRLSRSQRRASSLKPHKTLPPILTNLFDAAYFPNPESVKSPLASPAAATDEALKAALPDDIAMFLCEYDMLLQEGHEFAKRLKGLGKRVTCEVVGKRVHGFDKQPSLWGLDLKVTVFYTRACEWLGEIYKR